ALQTRAVAQNAESLYRSKYDFVAGNPKGNVTVVEFFDYNCGFCKRALGDIVKLINTDDQVRVVFKELPIFGKPSEETAKLALASIEQGKYMEYHVELLKSPGRMTKARALKIAEKLGLDVEKLQKDVETPKIEAALAANRTLANNIGLQGTPLYLVGDQIIPGAPEDLYDQLMSHVKQIRTKGCRVAAC
ncbi:MAG: DsbA family protein, partial [Methyloligellaceae bacterium]